MSSTSQSMNWSLFRLIDLISWHLKTITKTSLSATNYLIEHNPAHLVIVVVGGFVEATTVKWSDPTLSRLEADHEEVDSHT